MAQIREDAFAEFFHAGGIRNVVLVIEQGRARIAFSTSEGPRTGVIVTKRGEVKSYRVETALAFLRRLGLAQVLIDMQHWELRQQQLEV
ncbi:hypothetical protein AU374_00985 [Cupriavidus metallidurans]|uniref:hypothetical protein n=1 Tax=Cupriavidus metallidurans TaxID=119219 RepID=UPI000763B87E|nr:hypothetical protein [Cupriavidus metallidurans]KWW38199.1 hypothetical protein AU374_00985 [Cupriavidus metallidurans]